MPAINRILFRPVDNSPLIVFRILFGFLIFLESWGAILTGWVKATLIDPPYFTFTFIGFEWLQPLPGNGMYVYYIIMGLFALMVMLGWHYRIGAMGFFLMWTATYLMQKTSYNNHYYLLILLSAFMIFMPANRYCSLDVKRNPALKLVTCPQWCIYLFIFQTSIVYIYASIAKLYPDWLAGKAVAVFLQSKIDFPLIGNTLLQAEGLKWTLTYGGILFDGLVIPLLLWKRTRLFAFVWAIVFHLFNSIVFQVGIFPYTMLALSIFFFSPEQIRALFFKKKTMLHQFSLRDYQMKPSFSSGLFTGLLFLYIIIQIALPLRHFFYPGNVHWTEEGHRLAWRMMLRAKSGTASFKVVDLKTGEKENIVSTKYLSKKQARALAGRPDMVWQFAQFLKQEYARNGKDSIAVFVNARLGLNGRSRQTFINPEADLAAVKWQRFKHSEWIVPMEEE